MKLGGRYTLLTSLAATLFILLLTPYTSAILANGSQCGVVNQSITLIANINTSETCFQINASNLLIDGAGFNVTSDDGGQYAFNVSGFNNITIKNFGNISNFTYGVSFINSNNSALINNTFFSENLSTTRNIYASSVENLTIANNSLYLIPAYGGGGGIVAAAIRLEGASQGIVVSNNVIDSTSGGIELYPSAHNTTVEYNTVSTSLNVNSAALVIASNDNIVRHNTLFSDAPSTGYGVQTSGITGLELINNTINTTQASGIIISSSSDITLINNTVTSNSLGAFRTSSNPSDIYSENNIYHTTGPTYGTTLFLGGSRIQFVNDTITADTLLEVDFYTSGTHNNITFTNVSFTSYTVNRMVTQQVTGQNLDIYSNTSSNTPTGYEKLYGLITIVSGSALNNISLNFTIPASNTVFVDNSTTGYFFNGTWNLMENTTYNDSTRFFDVLQAPHATFGVFARPVCANHTLNVSFSQDFSTNSSCMTLQANNLLVEGNLQTITATGGGIGVEIVNQENILLQNLSLLSFDTSINLSNSSATLQQMTIQHVLIADSTVSFTDLFTASVNLSSGTIANLSLYENSSVPEGNGSINVSFSLYGAGSANLTISYLQSQVSAVNESSIALYYYNTTSSNWEVINSTLNTTANIVTANSLTQEGSYLLQGTSLTEETEPESASTENSGGGGGHYSGPPAEGTAILGSLTRLLGLGGSVDFRLTNKPTYSITLLSRSTVEGKARIKLLPGSELDLFLLTPKYVDLDNDGVQDISLTLQSIKPEGVLLNILDLAENDPLVDIDELPEESETEEISAQGELPNLVETAENTFISPQAEINTSENTSLAGISDSHLDEENSQDHALERYLLPAFLEKPSKLFSNSLLLVLLTLLFVLIAGAYIYVRVRVMDY